MNQIGLSLEILLQIEYHWLYGLVLTKNITNSLGHEMKEMFKELDEKNRSEKLEQLEQAFNHFVRLPFLYRNLIWLLNSSIRKNYYLRSAVHANLIFDAPWNHSSDYNHLSYTQQHQEALSRGYLFVGDCRHEYSHFNLMVVNNILKGDYQYHHIPSNAPPKKEVTQAEDVDSSDPLVQITPSIQEKLKVLGCEATDAILLSEIKKAYKRQALKTHPDKNSNPDAHTQFLEIKKAYDNILNDINPNDFKNFYYTPDIAQFLAEMEEDFQKKVREVEACLKQAQALIEETEVLQSQVRAYLKKRNQGLFRPPQGKVQDPHYNDIDFSNIFCFD